jgi:hypothetical protein
MLDLLKEILPYLTPVITGFGGWFFGKRKKDNDFLQELQASIDILSQKNTELVKQVILLNSEIINLKRENAALRVEVEELSEKLKGIKTITRRAEQ